MPVTCLSDRKIRSLKPREAIFMLGDGQGLLLQVHPSGSKSWVVNYRLNGKDIKTVIGSYPALCLAEARQKARSYRALAEQGLDPRRRLAENGPVTWGKLADEWLTTRLVRVAQRRCSRKDAPPSALSPRRGASRRHQAKGHPRPSLATRKRPSRDSQQGSSNLLLGALVWSQLELSNLTSVGT